MPRPKKHKLPAGGKRVGTKRRDMRWQSADGQMWDSRFEAQVYDVYIRSGNESFRRTVKGSGDTVSYTMPVRDAACDSCGKTAVSKRRSYTPDFFHDGAGRDGHEGAYFVETKGYLRAAERSLLRALCKARKDVSLRIIYQRDFPVSKSLTITAWTSRFLKIPYAVWDGKVVDKWIMPAKDKRKKK